MTPEKLGDIMKVIRRDYLKLNQDQLAECINSSQALVSRFEAGNGTLEQLLDFMNYLAKEHKLKPHLIFIEPFDVELLFSSRQTNVQQILAIIGDMKDQTIGNFAKLELFVNALE